MFATYRLNTALVLACCLVAVLVSAVSASAAPALKVGDEVVSIREDLTAYESLEKARAGGETEGNIRPPSNELASHGPASYNHTYKVEAIQDGWAEVIDSEEDVIEPGPWWVAADGLTPVADYLKDPANKAVTMACPAAMPERLTADLDSHRKGAVLKLGIVPTLDGGIIDLEVWDAAEKNRLWTSRDPANQARVSVGEGISFNCSLAGPTWPQIVGDVDGDGRAELLFLNTLGFRFPPAPPQFSRVRWTGKTFERLPDFGLTVARDAMPKSGRLSQDPPKNKGFICLEDVLELAPNGRIKGTFIRVGVTEGEYAILQRGQGWFRIDAAGRNFTFEGWARPLKDVAEGE